jgi:hypothetical protein
MSHQPFYFFDTAGCEICITPTHILPIRALPAVRMVKSDKWSKRPSVERNFAYRNELKLLANVNGVRLYDTLRVVFMFKMPEGWSKTKKEAYMRIPHQQTPDTDNAVTGQQINLC